MAGFQSSPPWSASAMRWIAGLFESLADRLERTFASHTPSANHDLYFDSDVYLAEIRTRALERHDY